MSKYRAVWDRKGLAYEYQNGELTFIRDDLKNQSGPAQAHMVMPDSPDFVSPIDGKLVRGRAGIRDHCARHNVVPTSELAGLPPMTMHRDYVPTKAQREEVKHTMGQIISERGYFRGR